MQLLAACQKSASVRKLVVKSSSAVYGSSAARPGAVRRGTPSRGPCPAAAGRRTPSRSRATYAASRDVVLTSPWRRCRGWPTSSDPRVETSMTAYFSLPVLPTVLGYDARLQFVHEGRQPGGAAARRGRGAPRHLQAAGDGTLTLSQACADRPDGRWRPSRRPLESAWPASFCAGRGSPTSSPEQVALPVLRPVPRHDPHARGAGLLAALDEAAAPSRTSSAAADWVGPLSPDRGSRGRELPAGRRHGREACRWVRPASSPSARRAAQEKAARWRGTLRRPAARNQTTAKPGPRPRAAAGGRAVLRSPADHR